MGASGLIDLESPRAARPRNRGDTEEEPCQPSRRESAGDVPAVVDAGRALTDDAPMLNGDAEEPREIGLLGLFLTPRTCEEARAVDQPRADWVPSAETLSDKPKPTPAGGDGKRGSGADIEPSDRAGAALGPPKISPGLDDVIPEPMAKWIRLPLPMNKGASRVHESQKDPFDPLKQAFEPRACG